MFPNIFSSNLNMSTLVSGGLSLLPVLLLSVISVYLTVYYECVDDKQSVVAYTYDVHY